MIILALLELGRLLLKLISWFMKFSVHHQSSEIISELAFASYCRFCSIDCIVSTLTFILELLTLKLDINKIYFLS